MDFVNQTIAQLRDLFATMTPGARITAALLLAVVVVSVGFLFQQASIGPDEYLFGAEPIASSKLARMESAIAQANIEYQIEGNRLRVSQGDKNRAIAAIAEAKELPADFFGMMDDAISRGSMFEDRETKRRRIESAREQQVSHLLTNMSWVDQALVMYNHREQRGLRAGRHASAAVSLLPEVGERLTTERSRYIKSLVAHALDVTSDKITVINRGPDAGGGSEGVEPDDFEHPYYALKTKYERSLKSQLHEVLDYIPGVRIGVKAEIDATESRRTVQVTPEKEAVELSSDTIDDKTVTVRGPAGNRPGVETNSAAGPLGRDTSLAQQDRTEVTTDHQDKSFAVGSTKQETTTIGFALKEAEASIGIPHSFVLETYRDLNRNPDGTPPEQIDQQALTPLESDIRIQVENQVKPLLPKLSAGQDELKHVSIEFFHDLPKPPMPQPSQAANAIAWLDRSWDTLAMSGLAVFSLLVLRSVLSSVKEPEPTGGQPSLRIDSETQPETESDDEQSDRPKLKLRKPESLKDDLTDMVATDPEAAAAILRSWINNAG